MRPRRLAVAGLALALLASGGAASAGSAHPQDVDPLVGMEADTSSASTPIPVIVYGSALGGGADPELSVRASLSGDEAAGTVTAGQLDKLASEPNVDYVAPDVPVQSEGTAARGALPLSALYPVVDDAPQVWAQGLTGAGVGIAIVDSGLDVHAAFDSAGAGRVAATAGAYGGNDKVGHGSLVASVAAGQSDDGRYSGIAPGATVVSYNVASGDVAYTSDVLRGLAWVLANQARYNIRVVNLSLTEIAPSSYQTSPLDAAVEILWRDAHIVVVTAAGNLGPGGVDYAPANDPFVIGVGATDPNGTASTADDTLTPWSSYGTTGDGFAKPDVVAPGRHIAGGLSRGSLLGRTAPSFAWIDPPTYLEINGTSFAAPQVTGAAAVLLQEHPDWTPDQVKWVLTSTSRAVAGSSAGALDLAAAVSYQGAPPSANVGVTPSAFPGTDLFTSLVQGDAAPKQATWTGAPKQATWTLAKQATWTASKQATWTAAHSQATWTGAHAQATWTDFQWGS